MPWKHRAKSETPVPPPLHIISATRIEGRDVARVVLGSEGHAIVVGVPVRSNELRATYRELNDRLPTVPSAITVGQIADFAINRSVTQPEEP